MSKSNKANDAFGGRYSQKSEYFDIVREQLQFWPYTIHQIDDTLDAGLIEARAKQLLFRAIHARNLTAFVGSGLSMSYGRLDWRSWEKEQNRTVTRKATLFQELCKTALEWQRWLIMLLDPHLADSTPGSKNARFAKSTLWRGFHPEKRSGGHPILAQQHKHNVWQWLRGRERVILAAQNRIQKLSATLELISNKPGHFPGGEELPVKFEIAQQLHNELSARTTVFLKEDKDEYEADIRTVLEYSWAGARFVPRTDAPIEGLTLFYRKLLEHRRDLQTFRREFVKAKRAYRVALLKFWQLNQRPEAKLDFETMSKTLLVDECPHAALLLRRGLLKDRDRDKVVPKEDQRLTRLERDLGVFDQSNQRRDIKGIRENDQRYRVLTPFSFDHTQLLIAKAKQDQHGDPSWVAFLDDVNDRLAQYRVQTDTAGVVRQYLTPSSRYLTALALALQKDPYSALGIGPSGNCEPALPPDRDQRTGIVREGPQKVDPDDPRHPMGPPPVKSFSGRRSILAERFDPMPKIHGDLKVTRYITTNYDFEIERYFQDIGYRTFDPPRNQEQTAKQEPRPSDSVMRRDELGRMLRDRSFAPETAAQLTSFAMAASESGADVMHLHGRSTKRDGLVITERDYMRLYLTDDEHRPTIDEGIQIAFSGAPLLFLGLGMEETDLLRPLRQFISNRDRTIGYTSIALLPAEKALAARTKFSASLYMRYGVHTVFYGSGQVSYLKVQDRDEEDGLRKFPIDWLHRIIQLCNGLRDELSHWEKEGPTDRKRLDILKDLIKGVGKLEDDLASEGYPADGSALLVLLDQKQNKTESQLEHLAGRLSKVSRHNRKSRGSIELKTCDFVPTRASKHRKTHRDEARTRIDGATYVGFYTRQLDRLLTMVMQLPDKKEQGSVEMKKHCAPIRIALDGLQGAFITGSLNAALEGINQEKRAWWKSWQSSPDHRLAEFQRLPPVYVPQSKGSAPMEDPVKLGTVFLRHKLDNVLTPLDDAQDTSSVATDLLEPQEPGEEETARLCLKNRTKVRSFDTFVAAVASTFKHRDAKKIKQTSDANDPKGLDTDATKERIKTIVETEKQRRQLITVAARRGMGKGTFMSAFSTELGRHTYEWASWPMDDVFFAGFIHINLGFSPEIASTYDMLARALIGIVVALEMDIQSTASEAVIKKSAGEYNARFDKHSEETQRLSRHAALTELFHRFRREAERYREKPEHPNQPRLLLNICAGELLFDGRGQPKNREISRFIELLFGGELRDCPVDIVWLADDAKLGAFWSAPEGESLHRRRYLNRRGLDLFAQEQIKRSLDSSKINMDEDAEESLERLKDPYYVSTLPDHHARKIQEDDTVEMQKGWPESHFVHFTRPVNTAWLLIDNFQILALALHLMNPPGGKGDPMLKDADTKFARAVVEARLRSDAETSTLWRDVDVPNAKDTAKKRQIVNMEASESVKTELIAHAEKHAAKSQNRRLLFENSLSAALRYRLYRQVNKRDAIEWRQVRRGLGNSRFSLTLLLAAAENMVVHSENPMQGAERAERLLLDTVARVRTVGSERRDQMVFESVLETYRGLQKIGDPDLDCELHLLLIKHLGVIGTPVGSAVLVRLSDIRKYFFRIGIETETSRRRFLVRALTTMAHRGLVFRLDPHPRLVGLAKKRAENEDWPADREYRYALHRVVQSFALSALEAGPLEPVATNRFSPTLYASMPSQGPTLSRSSYKFLRSLIIGLSQYPDVPAAEDSAEPWLFTTKDHEVKVQAARAAVSLARSNFSVAVVSRLAIHETIGKGVQKRGYLEIYRVRLRWLVRIAYDLAQQTKSKEDKQVDVAARHKQLNVLYRDEIVWLYNELGVVALAQGALSDALGYLRQAAEANEQIEGLSRSAPIYNHIDLNHAVVQLERGHFVSARHRLGTVKQANARDKCRLYHVAKGYECVIDHLQGRTHRLNRRYKDVTTYFEREKEDRSAAIFLLHQSRFLSHTDDAASSALELVERARTLAHASGHEDVRHYADLVAICVRLNIEGAVNLTLSDQKVLHQVEEFSRRMSIWKLSVEALHLRAQILLPQNENMAAGRHLVRAMAIAKRHDMNLRLNGLMTTYARVLLLRGDQDGARLMAEQSLERAKSCGYALETSRAQDVIRDSEIGLRNTRTLN